jgi:hypothetical protein
MPSEEEKETLRRIYYSPKEPGGLSGFRAFYRAVKKKNVNIPKRRILEFLRGESGYTQYKPARKRFPRRPIVPIGLNREWEIDLLDVRNLSQYNEGVKYILAIIDTFSKKLRMYPLKNKTAATIINVLETTFTTDATPTLIYSDSEGAVMSREFDNFLNKYGVQLFRAFSETKAPHIERVIRTFYSKLARYLHINNTYKYVDKLDEFVSSYNNSPHRTLRGLTPNEINESNADEVWEKVYKPKRIVTNPHSEKGCGLRVGQAVRISVLHKTPFKKGYWKNFSTEIFKIKTITPYGATCHLELEDQNKLILQGKFYPQEVTPVIEEPADKLYIIEKIIKTRTRAGRVEHLVKWLNFSPQYNSWVNDADIRAAV